MTDFKTCANNISGDVSLSGPFLDLVNGVLTAAQITTSSGPFGFETPAEVLFSCNYFDNVVILSIF